MSSSIFLIPPKTVNSNPQTSFTFIDSLISNPLISKYTSISQLTSYLTYNNSTIYELEISSISAIEFINKIHSVSPTIKTIPSNNMRSLILKGIHVLVPLVDVFTILNKVTPGVKKVVQAHHPGFPGVSQGIFLVDYLTHDKAMKALEVINAKKKLNCIKGNIEAFIAEPLIDNLKNIMEEKTNVLGFENLNVNVVDVFEFKKFIENLLVERKDSKNVIKKIRQYATKIIIEFSYFPKCFQSFIDKTENLTYQNRNVLVKSMMKPSVNIGKYKEKNLQLSLFSLTEEDRNAIFQKIETKKNPEESALRKKAENVYNKILQEEKRAQEKEREEYFAKHKKREREGSDKRRYHDGSVGRRMEDSHRGNDRGRLPSPRNLNSIGGSNNNPNSLDFSKIASLFQGGALPQLIQLLSTPGLNINQLLPNIAQLQGLQNAIQNQSQGNQPTQGPNNNNQQSNLVNFQGQVPQNLSYLLSTPNLLQAFHQDQQPNQIQNPPPNSNQPQPQVPNISQPGLQSQGSPNLGQGSHQLSQQYNPMYQISKLLPNTMNQIPSVDMLQPFFLQGGNNQNNKNYFPPSNSQVNPQQIFPFPIDGMFMNQYNMNSNQNMDQNQSNPNQHK